MDNNPPNSNFNQTPNNFSFFSQQSFRGFTSGDARRREFEYPQNHPVDVRGSIQRELEKERIRAKLIAEEIMRRRILEEEVRREMMFERELSLRRSELEFGIGRSRVSMRAPLPTNIENQSGFWAVPFQRGPVVVGSGNGVVSQEFNGVVSPTDGNRNSYYLG